MSRFTNHLLVSFALIFSTGLLAKEVVFSTKYSEANLSTTLIQRRSTVDSVRIQFVLPKIEMNREGSQTELKAPGLTPIDIEGNPDLFGTGTLLAVPNGYEPEISISNHKEQAFKSVIVKPIQKKFRCGSKVPPVSSLNQELYASKKTYPASFITIEEAGYLQNLRMIRIAITPLQMDFEKRMLRVTTNLEAIVHFKKINSSQRSAKLSKTLYSLARTLVPNASEKTELSVDTNPEVMIIVTADEFIQALDPFIKWKTDKGIKVEVFSFSTTGSTKEKLKEFLQTYYDSHDTKPTYLVFVGNGKTIPPFFEKTGSGKAATDYPFTLLSGNDAIPDVLYSRFVVDNLEELNKQISRQIAYEKHPEIGQDWYTKGMTIASDEGTGPSDKEYAEKIQEHLKKFTYKSVDGFYQGTNTATSENISNALVDGRSWIAYFGHGSGTSWGSTNNNFSVNTVNELKNASKLPILIDVACKNGSYTDISPCFAKAWVNHTIDNTNAGAIAFLGGTVNISWHPPAVMSVGIAKYHFEKPVHTLGGSVLAGQLYLMEQMGTGNNVTDNFKWYTLFGDPSMIIRTDTPKVFQVEHSISETEGKRVIHVNTLDINGNGVGDLLVSLTKDTNSILGKTDLNGHAILNIPTDMVLSNGLLTITGYNAQTFSALIE